MLGGSALLSPPVRGRLGPAHPPPGAPSQAPDAFGCNPPSQLVIMNHWLAFLNQVRINLSPRFNLNVAYKIDHFSKNKNRIRKLMNYQNPFQNIAHLLG